MCRGTATKLLCSHYLIHWSGPRCPKNCVLPDRRNFLLCTCAACDPSFNRTQILLRYAAEQDLLCAQIRTAMEQGHGPDVVRALERRVRALQGRQLEELGRTRVIGLDPAVSCRWPGMYEQWVTENLGRTVDWDVLLN